MRPDHGNTAVAIIGICHGIFYALTERQSKGDAKKEMEKRVLSLLLVLVMLLGMLPGGVLAADETDEFWLETAETEAVSNAAGTTNGVAPLSADLPKISLTQNGEILELTDAGTTVQVGYAQAAVYTCNVGAAQEIYADVDNWYACDYFTVGGSFSWDTITNPIQVNAAENTYLVFSSMSMDFTAVQFLTVTLEPSAAPTITENLGTDTVSYGYGDTAAPLQVTANGNGTLSYQWQVSTTAAQEDFADIDGATANSYTPPTDTVGEFWYRVVVSNTEEGKAPAGVTSAVTPVKITAPEGKSHAKITTSVRSTSKPLTFTMTDSESAPVELAADYSSGYAVYDLWLTPDTYHYSAADGEYTLGSGDLTVSGDSSLQEYEFYLTYVYASNNSGWTAEDFTTKVKDSKDQVMQPGEPYKFASYVAYPYFMAPGSYTFSIQPGESKAAEGYQATSPQSKTLSATKTNATWSAKMAQQVGTTFTVPDGATVTVTTAPAHPYGTGTAVQPSSSNTDAGETDGYIFPLTAGSKYIYRVSKEGLVTYTSLITAGSDAKDYTVTADMMSPGGATPGTIDRTLGSNHLDTADLRLNGVDHTGSLALSVGDTAQLTPIRMWRTANGAVGTKDAFAFEPDYHYAVVAPDGTPSDVVTVSADGKITAAQEGTAIVLVTYDAMYVGASGYANVQNQLYSAIWPENTGVVVVEVGSDVDAGPDANLTINADNNNNRTYKTAGTDLDGELDVLYYTGADGYSYTFTPESGSTVTLLRPTLSEAAMTYSGGFSTDGVTANEDGTVTLTFTEGKNIVKVSKGGQDTYQVVTAKQAEVTINNLTNPGMPIQPGDQVEVVLDQVYNPVNQMAYLYNFYCQISYTDPGTDKTVSSSKLSSTNRPLFDSTASARTVTVTIPENWNPETPYILTDGVFTLSGNGKDIGHHHKETLSSLNSTMSSSTKGTLGALPDITIPVQATKTYQVTFDVKDGDTPLSDYLAILRHSDGTTIQVQGSTGSASVTYGEYQYIIFTEGYQAIRGTLKIDQTSQESQTVTCAAIKAAENAWDGLTTTEPQKDESGVYQIGTGAELAWLSDYVNQGKATAENPVHAVLTADIDLAGYDWTPIGGGTAGKIFRGTFDGQGHEVRNLYIDLTDTSNVGLFGNISGYNVAGGSAVRNLTVASGSVKVTTERKSITYFGGIAGQVATNVTIENCINKADVTVSASGVYALNVGGIVGYTSDEITIKNCGNFGTITTTDTTQNYGGPVGGIVGGVNRTTTVNSSFNRGRIVSTGEAGGIAGNVSSSATGNTFTDVYNTGAVTGGKNVGGLVGALGRATLSNGYSSAIPGLADGADGNLGGAIGSLSSAELANIYYYSGTQGTAAGIGSGIPASGGAAGKTLDQLQALTSTELSGSFTSDAASENQGYPILLWEADVTSLAIEKRPNKTSYTEGDTIDLTGMVVKSTVNGVSVTLNNALLTVTPSTLTTTGTVTITVSYAGHSDTFTVQVKKFVPPEPEDIQIETTLVDGITQKNSRRTFDVFAADASGKKINVKNLTVKLNDSEVKHNWDDDEKTSYTLIFTQEGANTVTISAMGKTVSYTIFYEKAEPGEVVGQAVFAMESFTLGGGYIIEPQYVDIIEGENSAELLLRILDENGFTYDYTGSPESNFYLSSIEGSALSKIDADGNTIPEVLRSKLGSVMSRDPNVLGEFDYTSGSGWMYCVNCVFPNVGFADYYMGDGDVMRVQFTLTLGADIGGGHSLGGGGGAYYTIADKDELTTLIADVGLDKVPEAVRRVVEKLDATQSEVNKAVETLQNLEGTENDGTGTSDKVTSEVAPEVVVDKNGVASVTVSETEMKDAIATAKSEGSDAIVIAPQITGEATKVTTEVPTQSLKDVVKNTDAALEVQTDVGSVSIPNDALDAIAQQAGGNTVAITVEAKDVADLKEQVSASQLEGATVVEVTVTSGKTEITTFGGKPLTITIPVNSAQFTAGEIYKVLVISADGSRETVFGACAKQNEKLSVQVKIAHLGTFVVTTQKAMPFTDVSGHWAAEAIAWAYENGLMNGTGETTFAPNATLNRAMLATILYRLAGEPAVEGEGVPFNDVALDAWYTDAVIWANENGIVTGYGNGLFGSNDSITREQLAVMLYRYAKFMKYDTAESGDLSAFADAGDTSGWAAEALSWAYAEGIITGRTTTTIAPQGTATRAEVATILMRFANLEK